MNRASYPTDLTDGQSARIEHLLPAAKTGGRPAKHERLAVLNAILYLVRSVLGGYFHTICRRGRPSTITSGVGASTEPGSGSTTN
jgi:transposase